MAGQSRVERGEAIERGPNGISFVRYSPWKSELVHGTTLRNLNNDPRRPFDLASDSGIPGDRLSRDWELLRKSIAPSAAVVAGMEQVHGGRVKALRQDHIRGGDVEAGGVFVDGCDGLITNVPDILLTVRVADCVPIFLFDPVKEAIGLLHAGWRGTAAEIVSSAVGRMKEEYSTEPSDLQLYMGPSIEWACYPVNRDVYGQFEPWNEKSPEPEGDWKLDLRGINRQQAIAEGIPGDRIIISRYCTACSKNMFYSYRASGGDCGRMAAFLALRK